MKHSEINRMRRRAAPPIAIWLGGLVAMFPLVGILFAATAIVPESQWPKLSSVTGSLLYAVALGVYGAFWKLSGFIIWRIVAGRQNCEDPNAAVEEW